MRTAPPLLALLCSLLSLSLVASRATASPAFELPGEHFTWAELAPVRRSTEGYGEKYTFNAELKSDSGETGSLYLSLMITNLGPGDHKMTAKGRVTFGDRSQKWKYKLSAKKWKSQARPLLIQAGGVTVKEQQGALVLELKHPKVDLSISMTELARNWQPKGGGLKLGKHITKVQTLPLTLAQGRVEFKGEQAHSLSVRGKGWGSHSASDIGPQEQNLWSRMLRAVDLERDQTVYLRTIKTTREYGSRELSYLIVTQGDQLIFEGTGFDVQVKDRYVDKKKYGYRVPLSFHINARHVSDPKVHLSADFKTLKRTRRRDPIAKRSWAEKLIIERFSKPMEYGYDLEYKLNITGSRTHSLTGQAKYEVFHFNKK